MFTASCAVGSPVLHHSTFVLMCCFLTVAAKSVQSSTIRCSTSGYCVSQNVNQNKDRQTCPLSSCRRLCSIGSLVLCGPTGYHENGKVSKVHRFKIQPSFCQDQVHPHLHQHHSGTSAKKYGNCFSLGTGFPSFKRWCNSSHSLRLVCKKL